MAIDFFKRALRRETRRSIKRIVNESRRINEDLGDVLDDVSGSSEESGLSSALDSQISPVEDNKQAELQIQQQINKRNAQINEVLIGWVDKLDEFVSFINDPMNEESIKYITDSAAPGSILEKIKNSEARRLTKVATECSSLAQSLRSYITGGIEDNSAESDIEPDDTDMDMEDDVDLGDDVELEDDTEV